MDLARHHLLYFDIVCGPKMQVKPEGNESCTLHEGYNLVHFMHIRVRLTVNKSTELNTIKEAEGSDGR
jgi:hypothetical protein